jgi:predicted enzyme related to lactoylglutathione lyase
MKRVVHFDINADDPARAVEFYEDVFGWKIEKWEGPIDYWLVTTGPDDQPGINGGIMERFSPRESTIITINVPSVDAFMEKITRAGGKIIGEKRTIPGVGILGYCQDTEGNTFGIIQEDTSAV